MCTCTSTHAHARTHSHHVMYGVATAIADVPTPSSQVSIHNARHSMPRITCACGCRITAQQSRWHRRRQQSVCEDAITGVYVRTFVRRRRRRRALSLSATRRLKTLITRHQFIRSLARVCFVVQRPRPSDFAPPSASMMHVTESSSLVCFTRRRASAAQRRVCLPIAHLRRERCAGAFPEHASLFTVNFRLNCDATGKRSSNSDVMQFVTGT
jgi:hypothetical protein